MCGLQLVFGFLFIFVDSTAVTKVVQKAEDVPSSATVEDVALCLHGHLDADHAGPWWTMVDLPQRGTMP